MHSTYGSDGTFFTILLKFYDIGQMICCCGFRADILIVPPLFFESLTLIFRYSVTIFLLDYVSFILLLLVHISSLFSYFCARDGLSRSWWRAFQKQGQYLHYFILVCSFTIITWFSFFLQKPPHSKNSCIMTMLQVALSMVG